MRIPVSLMTSLRYSKRSGSIRKPSNSTWLIPGADVLEEAGLPGGLGQGENYSGHKVRYDRTARSDNEPDLHRELR